MCLSIFYFKVNGSNEDVKENDDKLQIIWDGKGMNNCNVLS
jgi:hypothetical protein